MRLSKFLIFIFCFLGGTVISCEEEEFGGSCPDVLPHFKILDIESSHIKFIETNAVNENDGNIPTDIGWDQFTLQFKFQIEYIAQIKKSSGSSLYALSCIGPGYEGDKVGVASIQIKTLADYNSSFEKNSNINEIIVANTWNLNDGGSAIFADLDTFVADNSDGIQYEVIEIMLTEGPTEKTSFSVEVELILNNGQKLTYETYPINIVN